jgi:small-conductance mechanosensitive channel
LDARRVPLATFALDLSSEVQSTLPVAAGMVAWTAFTLYLLAYLSRRIETNKAVLGAENDLEQTRVWGAKYFDVDTLAFLGRLVIRIWVGIYLYALLIIGAYRWAEVQGLVLEVNKRLPAILFVGGIWIVVAGLLKIMRRYGAYLRGELRAKPRNVAQPRLWNLAEGGLKYAMIAGAILISFVAAGSILPQGVPEKSIFESVGTSLTAPSEGLLKAIAIVVIVAIVAYGLARLFDSVFEDMKVRSRKHGPAVHDQFKGIARKGVYLTSFVVVLFLELALILDASQLLIVAVGFVLSILTLLIIAFDSLRNAFVGLVLMRADPFSVGDRVKIGEDLVGEVVGITLTLTQLRTGRGELVTIPNREVLATPVLNFTRSEHHPIFVEVEVGWSVAHGVVEELLIDAAKRTPGILESPPPAVFGKDVHGNAIVHQLLAYTKDPEQMKQVKSALLYTIQDLFHAEKLSLLASSTEG